MFINGNERIENTGFGKLKLIQNPEEFCYGVDAVILADFACSFCPDFNNAVDLGTGTGIIPLIMSHKGKNKNAILTGIEVQSNTASMAQRSCLLNGLDDRLKIKQGNVAEIDSISGLSGGCADVVTSNPPYVAKSGGIPNYNRAKYISRHETTASIDDFIKAAAWVLKDRGHFFLVHRPARLVDVIYCCRKWKLEPKDIRFVSPCHGKAPNIVLIHCVHGGGCELKIMNDLYVYDSEGKYTEEIQRIYERP